MIGLRLPGTSIRRAAIVGLALWATAACSGSPDVERSPSNDIGKPAAHHPLQPTPSPVTGPPDEGQATAPPPPPPSTDIASIGTKRPPETATPTHPLPGTIAYPRPIRHAAHHPATTAPPPPPPPGAEPPPSQAKQTLPAFPLPAPTASAQMTLGPSVYGAAQTLGDLDGMLTRVLGAHGYGTSKYYSAPGGYAMVVPIERIRADGSAFPMPGRWSFATSSLATGCSIWHLFDCLLHADPGHYRVIVFLATNAVQISAGPSPTFAAVEDWTTGPGGSFLPNTIAAMPLTGRHVVVLVYEFERPSLAEAPQQVTGLSAADHLRAAGLIR